MRRGERREKCGVDAQQSGGAVVVVLKKAAQSLPAEDVAVSAAHGVVGIDDSVVESLMVPLGVILVSVRRTASCEAW